MSPLVSYSVADGIADVRLNRPEVLNALTAVMVDELVLALERAIEDGVRAAVLSGNGRAFCAGHDLREVQDPAAAEQNQRDLERLQDVTRVMQHSPHPIVAAVHGYALGAGFEFALICDLIIAATTTEFGFPEVEVGLSVTGGITRQLPLAVGPARAKELIMLGGRFGAERALALGLVNVLVDDSQVHDSAMSMARQLAARPRASLATAKRCIDRGYDNNLAGALADEVDAALGLLGVDQGSTAGDVFRDRSNPRP